MGRPDRNTLIDVTGSIGGIHARETRAAVERVLEVQYFACQGGLGYEKPVTSFTVRNGRVVQVFMVAVAD